MKKIKKTMCLILTLSVLISAAGEVFATSTLLNTTEQLLMEEQIGNVYIRITETRNQDGSYIYKEYHDGKLVEAHVTVPKSGTINNLEYEDGNIVKSNTEVVALTDIGPVIQPMATQTRNLGYMHYNGTTGLISIFCKVKEIYDTKPYVINKNVVGSISYFATALVSATGILGKIATTFISKVLIGVVFERLTDGTLKAMFTTTVDATVYDQTIIGNCTTHSGKKEGKLTGQIAYVKTSSTGTKTYREGYTTAMWGTGELGRQMFWKVWGTEYTPTSWTGV